MNKTLRYLAGALCVGGVVLIGAAVLRPRQIDVHISGVHREDAAEYERLTGQPGARIVLQIDVDATLSPTTGSTVAGEIRIGSVGPASGALFADDWKRIVDLPADQKSPRRWKRLTVRIVDGLVAVHDVSGIDRERAKTALLAGQVLEVRVSVTEKMGIVADSGWKRFPEMTGDLLRLLEK